MAKKETIYISKMKQTFTGAPLVRGQVVKPSGARNDSLLFGDNTRWTYQFHGTDTDLLTCDSDGCPERFADADALRQHRLLVHAPERDARERAILRAKQERVEAEMSGDTVGGHPIEQVKSGPGGPVPYIDARGVLSG